MSGGTDFTVAAVCRAVRKGIVKTVDPEGGVLTARGLEGDAHAGAWHRQVSLLGQEDIDTFAVRLGRSLAPGEFGENLVLAGLDLARVAVLDRLTIGAAVLEITQIGKECHGSACAIFQASGDCIMPRLGLFARVLQGGAVRPGDRGRWEPRPLRAEVVTLSDRASAGEYEDRSGPRVRARLEAHFAATRWHLETQVTVLPDDADRLRALLVRLRDEGADLVVTTGGTGVGPRDMTPDVILSLAEKELPGIMDAIRLRHGASNPNALLSRSVAAVLGVTLVYALPGSVRAVDEYMDGLLPTLEHLLRMLHGIGH